ncbi:hypothetical protein LT330_007579 [Penicillium expansum]|nr:hypothetical protein LT330_007579 [Penicillium expansum]KGO41735.1 Cupin 2, conserved barrel [Penicillium expansum]
MTVTLPADNGPVPPTTLPPPTRVITTHTPDGKSVFERSFPREIPVQEIEAGASAALTYVTKIPASLTKDADVNNYSALLKDPPGLTISDAAVLRSYDMAPGVESPLHRTMSIDFLVVLRGEMLLTLDSGETENIRAGEVVVQRGTMHSWKNVSSDWARMLAVTIPVNNLVVGGEVMGEHLGGIPGLKDST